jgi:proteasome lid subunit RPN8/RPN11
MIDRVYAIDGELIDSFNESARSCYPDEFICMMRESEGVLTEMILLPGTVYGDSHSFLNEWMSPIDYNLAGSAHSHPGYSNEPSDADLQYFGSMGGVHIISCQPYDRTSWKAYNSKGEALDLEVRD